MNYKVNGPLLAAFICLLLFLTALYAPALRFGLIWDDPEWYMQAVGKSTSQLLFPSTQYQYYRPWLMIYNHQFIKADGTIAIYLLHWAQIGWYLLNLTLIFGISRKVGFDRWAAFMVVVLSALHPFVYQAIAWEAPSQPIMAVFLNTAWVLYLVGRERSRTSIFVLSAFCFLIAMGLNETAVALAAIPLLLEIALRLQKSRWQDILKSWRHPWQNGWGWTGVYLIMAVLFTVIWLVIPRENGVVGLFWDVRVYAYMLQGFVLAFASSALVRGTIHEWSLIGMWGLLIVALWGLALYRKRGTLATIGLIWAFLAIAPGLIGLPFDYISIASRMFYTAVPGVAWLWVSALWPAPQARWSATAVLGAALLIGMALFGLVTTIGFGGLYSKGINHLAEMVDTLADKNGSYLFVNFPDRYHLKEEPLAVGYWGLTLAPVVVDLDEFPALLHGSDAQTISRSMPWLDETSRAEGPYHVDMRGVITPPNELYQLAAAQEGIYVTRYDTAGNFSLHYAGALSKGNDENCGTAVFDNTICLQDIQLTPAGDELIIRTTWWTSEPLPEHLTLYTHLAQPGLPPAAQADGDSWQGALPLANWQPGDLILDERRLPLPPAGSDWRISLGVYNWVTGARLTAVDNQERPLPDNAFVIPIEQ
ncbi:MAG: hypothetical protein IAF02_16690 [Anaerolineae bacterium]|nr:hypothetical protein [Anaerolineae bacterium]